MSLKVLRYGLASTAGVLILGGLIFGSELMSYVRTSAGSVRESVRDSVPIEFELQRARDLINEILPELHCNIRIIAEDEVEIAALEKDLTATRDNVKQEREQLVALRNTLKTQQVSYEIGGREYSRPELAERLAQRLTRVKDAELIQTSKEKLLETRKRSLHAAMELLDRARGRKVELEQKVESLVAQHRLVQASAVGSRVQVSDTKLARADQLLVDIQKRLDVAERVLEHEASPELTFDEAVVDEASLLAEVDEHLGKSSASKQHVAASER
ncbi:signal peptide-containing protein [bacterium]|nr:signal peptide-containing protein [bacterium]